MSIELMLLSVNTNFIIFSHYSNDITGQVFVFFILAVAAAESAIGLAIIVSLFRARNSLEINLINKLKDKIMDKLIMYIPILLLISSVTTWASI